MFIRQTVTNTVRFIALILLSMALVACEGLFGDVDQNNKGRFTRPTDFLRFYQDGDWIEYDFGIIDASNASYGTLRIEWFDDTIMTPDFDGPQNLSVLREVSTLTISNDRQYTSVRYISQEQDGSALDTFGSVYVHAYADPLNPYIPGSILARKFYWISDDAVLNTINRIVALKSPLQQVATSPPHSADYYLFNGCDENNNICANIAQRLSEEYVYQDPTPAGQLFETQLGIFQYLSRMGFVINVSNVDTNVAPASLTTITQLCDATLASLPTATGNVWLHPGIGMIKLEGVCQANGVSVNLVALISNTNITLPPLEQPQP